MKRKRLVKWLSYFLGFGVGAIVGICVVIEGASRGGHPWAKFVGGLMLYPLALLDEAIGRMPTGALYYVVLGWAGLIPGLFGLLVVRVLRWLAMRRSSKRRGEQE